MEITDLTLPPGPIDVSNGARSSTIRFGFQDAGSGFSHGSVRLFDPSGGRAAFLNLSRSNLVEGSLTGGVAEVPFQLSRGAAPGTYTVLISASDLAGNFVEYVATPENPNQQPFPEGIVSTFEVRNDSPPDLDPPVLNKFEINPPVIDLSDVDRRVTVATGWEDGNIGGGIGIASASLFLYDSSMRLVEQQPVILDMGEGTNVFELSRESLGGEWSIHVVAVDAAGNVVRYDRSHPYPAGMTNTIQVLKPNEPPPFYLAWEIANGLEGGPEGDGDLGWNSQCRRARSRNRTLGNPMMQLQVCACGQTGIGSNLVLPAT